MNLFGGAPFGSSSGDVGAGGLVGSHPYDDDGGEGTVEPSAAAAVEPVAGGIA